MQIPFLGRLMRDDIDNFLAEKVKSFTHQPFADDGNVAASAEISEINGFQFLRIHLVAPIDVNTYGGGEVTFIAGENTLTVETDSQEIISLYSEKLGIGITDFDLDLDDTLKNFILQQPVSSIQFSFGNTIGRKKATLHITDITLLRTILGA